MKKITLILALCACAYAAKACDKAETISETIMAVVSDKLNANESTTAGEDSSPEQTPQSNSDADCLNLASAGSLEEALEGRDLSSIISLKLSGEMDARDFNFIKWQLQNIEVIDLSDIRIASYFGPNGTNEGYARIYPADEIPLGAFFYWCDHVEDDMLIENDERHFDEGMPSLRSVTLPTGIKAIRRNAFARAYNLTDINFPEGLELIDYVSFRYCVSLESIFLPSTLKEIGLWAFTEMASLKEVQCKAAVPPTVDSSFGKLTDKEGVRGKVDVGSFNASGLSATLYVPEESVDAYKESAWGTFFKEIKPIR